MSSPDPEGLDELLDELDRVEVEWLVLCDCTDRGEADGPSPGPNPGLCTTCGDRIRGEWIPTVPDQQENPTMIPTNATNGRDPSEHESESSTSKIGGLVALVVVVLLGGVAISLLLLALVTIWRVIL